MTKGSNSIIQSSCKPESASAPETTFSYPPTSWNSSNAKRIRTEAHATSTTGYCQLERDFLFGFFACSSILFSNHSLSRYVP